MEGREGCGGASWERELCSRGEPTWMIAISDIADLAQMKSDGAEGAQVCSMARQDVAIPLAIGAVEQRG